MNESIVVGKARVNTHNRKYEWNQWKLLSAKWNFSNHNDSRFLSTICSVANLPILEPVELILSAFFLEIYLKR